MNNSSDILVIGAGIAGVSAAAELAAYGEVRIVEMENQPAYHASGRSAAFFAPAYGNHVVRAFTAASEHFYRSPASDFTEVELLRKRDCFYIARADQLPQMLSLQNAQPELEALDIDSARAQVPLLSVSTLQAVLRDTQGGDLDVHAIMQAYLRLFRQRGGKLMNSTTARQIKYLEGYWQVRSEKSVFRAPVLVNAAGAWADSIAGLAGLPALGIVPKRRTAVLIDAPAGMSVKDWPMVIDVDEEFYFKPEAGQLLISPADETPSPPCDARPEELDIAIALDRFERATGVEVDRVNHSWAGLRSFAADKSFVAGFDPRASGFFWLAGQGGYGVQSAPAMAKLCSALVSGDSLSGAFASLYDYVEAVAPERLIEAS